MRNARGFVYSMNIPESWLKSQFPFVPVKHPETGEKVPLQRVTSRVVFFCSGQKIRSSAAIDRFGTKYDVLVPDPCRIGSRGVILSGSGRYVLTLGGDVVSNVDVARLLNDSGYRDAFFRDHVSEVTQSSRNDFSPDLKRLLDRIIRVGGAGYRGNSDTSLAMMIATGEGIDERFLLCGGGNINVVGTVVHPASALLKAGIAFGCAAVGEPQGLFVSDRTMFRELKGEQVAPSGGSEETLF